MQEGYSAEYVDIIAYFGVFCLILDVFRTSDQNQHQHIDDINGQKTGIKHLWQATKAMLKYAPNMWMVMLPPTSFALNRSMTIMQLTAYKATSTACIYIYVCVCVCLYCMYVCIRMFDLRVESY
jgi:hypothetical protein